MYQVLGMGGSKKMKPDSWWWYPVTGQDARALLKIQAIPLKHKEKPFYSKGCQKPEQVAKTGHGVSILGDTQSPIGLLS